MGTTTKKEGQRLRALEKEARREHAREARARLTALRTKLREALAAKKERTKALRAMCREQRLALKDRIRAMRAEGLAEIRERLRRDRAEARDRMREQKKQARATLDSAVAIVRAELAAERHHQAEQQRIARDHRARVAAHKKAPEQSAAEVRAALGPIAAVLDRAKRPIKMKSGETLTEAVLRYAEANPDKLHAAVEPHAERAVAHAKAAVAEATRAARSSNAYEEKKAARIERMRARADKARAESAGAFARERRIGDAIPMGQPVLVGHHSQRRHESDIRKMRALMKKGIELSKKAEALDRRAKFAESNRAISSDDPNAVAKLRAQLEKLNGDRERMRAANAAIRAGGDVFSALERLGISKAHAQNLVKPDSFGRIGFADYALTNASANARRIEQRIRELEAKANAPEREEIAGDVRIVEADNRVRVVFPSKPPEATRKALKGAGFRWSPTANAWQRHASNAAWYEARQIATAYAGR